jgi:ABC-type lipoprotein export system ATPase subunit
MHIQIHGYKNVVTFDEVITDGKINFISGRSGSGKSAIGQALLQITPDFNTTVGYTGPTNAFIDGVDSLQKKVMVFDRAQADSYFSDSFLESSDGQSPIYHVLIDQQSLITNAQAAVDAQVQSLKALLPQLQKVEGDFALIEKQFACKASINKKGKWAFTQKTFALKKYEASLKKALGRKTKSSIYLQDPAKVGWIREGQGFIVNNACPFCEKQLSKARLGVIADVSSFDDKVLSSFRIDPTLQTAYLISPISATLNSVQQMKRDLLEIEKASSELQTLKLVIGKIEELNSMSRPFDFVIHADHLVHFVPQLSPVLVSLAQSGAALSKAIDRVKSDTKAYLKNRRKEINAYIDALGIPYVFDAQYQEGRIDSYRLIHKNELKGVAQNTALWAQKLAEGTNRRDALSNGEKNALALIFFLESVKREDPDLIIIDDPASDYDEYKRQIILNSIRAINPGKTTLILSHDCVFEKLAICDRWADWGRITYCVNEMGVLSLKDVHETDFDSLENLAKAQAQQAFRNRDYFRAVINMRIFYESRGSTSRMVYSYLSGILHSVNNPTINVNAQITANNWDEGALIAAIESDFDIIGFPHFAPNLLANISTQNYTVFEKAVYLREFVKNNNTLRAELSSLVHLNSSLLIGLNPYEFDYTSQDVRSAISARGI